MDFFWWGLGAVDCVLVFSFNIACSIQSLLNYSKCESKKLRLNCALDLFQELDYHYKARGFLTCNFVH